MNTHSTPSSQPGKSITMRIDLIPDISDVPLSQKPKATFYVPKSRTVIRKMPTATGTSGTTTGGGYAGYAELFQNLYDAGIVMDLQGRVREVNPRAVEFFGYNQDAFTHLRVNEIIAGADDDLIRTLYENLQQQCFTLMQAYCVRADGSMFPAEVAVSQLRLSVPHLCFFVRDETLRRQMDEMLRTEHNALQNASDAIIITNLASNIDYANPSSVRLWGYGSGFPLAGNPFTQLFSDGSAAASLLSSLNADRFSAEGVLSARRFDGSVFNVEYKAACNRDSDGKVIGAVISFTDLTEREKYLHAEADAARLREVVERLSESRALIRERLADLNDIFKQSSAHTACATPACKTLLSNGADCASALEALFADVDEILG